MPVPIMMTSVGSNPMEAPRYRKVNSSTLATSTKKRKRYKKIFILNRVTIQMVSRIAKRSGTAQKS
jgi:hypothetical protein